MNRLAMFVLLLLAAPAASAGDDYDALFQKHGAAHGVDWRLLKALGTVESHLNPRAENPDGLSAGIMQIHCDPHERGSVAKGQEPVVTASAHGSACTNRFNIEAWPPVNREQLYDPDYNIAIGTQIIAWNIRHLGLKRGIAAYNQWSARKTRRGEPFPNQYYVDKVLLVYRQLKATSGAPVAGGKQQQRPPVSAPGATPQPVRASSAARDAAPILEVTQ